MICESCVEGDHPNCEDNTRYAKFIGWMQKTYGGPDGVVVGPEEMVVIKANRPYASCSCQHKGPDMKVLNERVDALHGPGAAAAIDKAYKDGTLFSQ